MQHHDESRDDVGGDVVSKTPPRTDDAMRRWVALNVSTDIAQSFDASPLLLEQKPSRPRRMAQAYACAKMLREELGADDKATLSCITRYFFPGDSSDSYSGAIKALEGRMSKAEREHGDALLAWLRSPSRCAAHCADLRREFARELRLSGNSDKESHFSDTPSSGLRAP